VPQPTEPDLLDGGHLLDVPERVLHAVDEFGFDAVHQAPADRADGADEQHHDHRGDEQPDDRVGQGEAEQHPEPTDHDGQRREAVRPGVDAVGH